MRARPKLHGENYMLINHSLVSYARPLAVGLMLAVATTIVHIAAAKDHTYATVSLDSTTLSDTTNYQWNLGERNLPLLGLSAPRITAGFDQSLGIPVGDFSLAIFR